jgi:ABC-type transporter Mla subunit MlaD
MANSRLPCNDHGMPNHLNKRTGSRVLAVAAVVGLVLGVSACGGAKKSATTTTSTTSAATAGWASSVCTAFTTWKSSLQATKADLTEGGVSETNLKIAGTEARDASKTLAQTLKTLGAPTTTGGEKAKQDLANFSTTMSFSVNKIQEALNSSPSSAAELGAAITDLKQAEATMVTALSTAVTSLKGFSPSGELEQAFKDSPSCAVYF